MNLMIVNKVWICTYYIVQLYNYVFKAFGSICTYVANFTYQLKQLLCRAAVNLILSLISILKFEIDVIWDIGAVDINMYVHMYNKKSS